MKASLSIANALMRLCEWSARVGAVFLFVLVGVIIYDVIGRRFFSTGSFVLQELEWHLHGVIAMSAFGYAYTRDAHVRIDVLAGQMQERFRLWLEFWVVVLLVIPFFLFIAWYGYEFALRAFERGEGANGGRGLPSRWIIKSVVPASALITIAGCAAVALRILAVLKQPGSLATPFTEKGLWKR